MPSITARASEFGEIQSSAAQARAAGMIDNKPLIVPTGVKQDDALKNAPELGRLRSLPADLGANAAAPFGAALNARRAGDPA
jgi:hypothetical protein